MYLYVLCTRLTLGYTACDYTHWRRRSTQSSLLICYSASYPYPRVSRSASTRAENWRVNF
eukprot:6203177-Pleurochrysis_carterae.AAC.8